MKYLECIKTTTTLSKVNAFIQLYLETDAKILMEGIDSKQRSLW